MKRFYVICGLISIVLIFMTACNSNNKNLDQLTKYIQSKGYEVVKTNEKVDNYILSKEKLNNYPYDLIWGLQKSDAKDYIGKEVKVYDFIVKNHPLDEAKNNDKHQTKVWLLVINNKIVGGYSLPDYGDYAVGSFYTLDGKTLEESTGMNLNQWSKMWKEKYK